MKKLTVNCVFNGTPSPFALYVGTPEGSHHPLQFQADWLSKERGGVVPEDLMETLRQLQDLAQRNNIPFEEMCDYALEESAPEKEEETES
ncbi:MAG: DUF2610 domain-containing protein [Rickettsiales bacterium]